MSEDKQLSFWRGQFGDGYLNRNIADEPALNAREHMWRTILGAAKEVPQSILEVGANIGLNLRALARLTTAELHAVEPHTEARARLAQSGALPSARIHNASADALPFDARSIDLVFTSGVLIHIAPENLLAACTEINRVSGSYIACAEYFNPTPVELNYRGHEGVLFKRDFGAFWLDNFPGLELVGYGFFWKRATGLDDLTWWLFRKPPVQG